MQKTRSEARKYAQMLADMHREPRVVVQLPKALPGSARDMHNVKGRFYGGVREEERQEFVEGGAIVIETVYPHQEER